MSEYIEEIKKALKKKLTPQRYEHTIGVMYTSISLAMRYGEDLSKAELAGLLHDCAKNYPDEKKHRMCQKAGIALSPMEKANPALIHAKLGAHLAKKKYGVTDDSICSAIRFHTTGRANMTLLEAIVFTADYIEPGRTRQPGLPEIRKMAFIDLDEAVYMILRDTVEYLDKGQTGAVDETTKVAYEWYRDLHQKKEVSA